MQACTDSNSKVVCSYACFVVQAGPVARISLPDTSPEGRQKFGFCFYESVVSCHCEKAIPTGVNTGFTNSMTVFCLQESAKYAHALFHNTVKLYGHQMRVDYSPQGNPEPTGTQLSAANIHSATSLVPGLLTAAGGGTIIKRKIRNQES